MAALGFIFDPKIATGGAAPLAELVANADSLEAARDALAAKGIDTELDYARRRFAGADG